MARILVTGVSGFLGSHVLSPLAAQHEVFAVVRSCSPQAPPRVHWVCHDLTQPLERATFPARVDVILHLAQSRQYRDLPGGAPDVFAVNTQATLNLLEYGRVAGIDRFVLASTGAVFGRGPRPFTEQDQVKPVGLYAVSKYAAELLVQSYEAFFQTVILRPFVLYGRGQQGHLIADLVENISRGRPVFLEGKQGMRVNPVHVSDAVAVALAVASIEAPQGVFNVAGDEVVTLKDLAARIGRLLGRAPVFSFRDTGPGDFVGNNQRAKQVLDIAPEVRLDDGLREMIADVSSGDLQ